MTVNLVLDLALRIGEVELSSGAGASDVTATIIAVANACGLLNCEVDVTFTSITVCCHRGPEVAPVTSLRVVHSRGLDYTRLAEVERLVRDITRRRISAAQAATRLDKITRAKHPYPRWVATTAWAGMAASVAVLLGGGLLVALVAALITAIVDRVGRVLNRRGLPFFFQQVVGGALATGGSLAVVSTGVVGERPTLVVAAAITVLLSGLSVVSAVQDAITGYNVTAAGRAIEIALMTAGLIGGVVLALNMAVELGMPQTPIAAPLPPSALRLPLQTVAGAAAAGCFALASYATLRSLLVASAAGALGAVGYGALVLANTGPIVASAAAAVGIGFCGGVMARRLRVTPLVVAVSGMTPLLPGLSTYRSMYELAVDGTTAGVGTLMTALGIALALGAGVVLGEYLAQPVRTRLGRLERRLGTPRSIGLRSRASK
ncbi:threonine/serine ThrE exporter family protein [Kibdelosporangium banguiense]|nr:threonine/serine exporter family protein [Kibdelosporangium banguiense]